MPELPEVETIKSALSDVLKGATVEALTFHRSDLRDPMPITHLEEIFVGEKVIDVSRRSKYILITTARGQAVVHLGMTGVFHCYASGEPKLPHTHFVIELRRSRKRQFLHYIDPRRFGRFGAIGAGAEEWLKNLGPEPLLGFDAVLKSLFHGSRNRRQSIKAFLMDPQNVVGVGNIYAAEALFRSRINPHKAAGELGRREMHDLTGHIIEVLQEAIAQGGTSFRDFKDINGNKGYFRIHLNVYGREGEPCRVCSDTVIRENIAGRSSFYCPRCQK